MNEYGDMIEYNSTDVENYGPLVHGEDIVQKVDGGANLWRLFLSRSVLGMNKSPCD